MARPREFDVEAVLHEVLDLFWEKGFDGTSFADIEARTGVKKASLFAAYGDKRSLFLKALRAYQQAGREATREQLAVGSPREAIRTWLAAGAATVTKEDCSRRGCFQVNSVVERGLRDADVLDLAREHTELLVDTVGEAIARGQRAGEFRADVTATVLAQFLLTSIQGLSVAAKAGLSGAELTRVADVALSALEP